MLFALRHPGCLILLVASFVIALAVRAWAQHAVLGMLSRRPRWARRRDKSMKTFIDPLGAVSAVLAGIGWGVPAPDGRSLAGEGAGYRSGRAASARVRQSVALLAGPVSNFLLAAVALVGYRLVGGPALLLRLVTVPDVVRGSVTGLAAIHNALLVLAVVSLSTGLMALVPIPPLDGGRLLFLLGGSTPGWRRAEYELSERNWGTGIVLALMLLPLAGSYGVGVALVDAVARPLLTLAAG